MGDPGTNVRAFPLSRLKFAGRLRRIADDISQPGAPDGGDVIVIYVDVSGIIHFESMLTDSVQRSLRMVGLLDAVRARLTDSFNYTCNCTATEDESDV